MLGFGVRLGGLILRFGLPSFVGRVSFLKCGIWRYRVPIGLGMACLENSERDLAAAFHSLTVSGSTYLAFVGPMTRLGDTCGFVKVVCFSRWPSMPAEARLPGMSDVTQRASKAPVL